MLFSAPLCPASRSYILAARCPDPGCRQPLPPHVLQLLLSAEEFERWEELLLQRTLDRMQDLVGAGSNGGAGLWMTWLARHT